MGVVVTFDYAGWVARYPEFAAVTQPLAQSYFDEATIYQANDGSGPVKTAAIQSTLLNMLTAHIAALYAAAAPGVSPLVGRISSATEGSVSVNVEMETTINSAWFMQTKYGASYWQATAGYRTMRYRVGCGSFFNQWPARAIYTQVP